MYDRITTAQLEAIMRNLQPGAHRGRLEEFLEGRRDRSQSPGYSSRLGRRNAIYYHGNTGFVGLEKPAGPDGNRAREWDGEIKECHRREWQVEHGGKDDEKDDDGAPDGTEMMSGVDARLAFE
ncbi:hypothetical protein MMC25_004666 [Agyrium rufum]|nr:hypothetical protein [Agyrium rufum]